MKKILFAVLAITACNFSNAQNIIPNPGFENWTNSGTYEQPTSWGTLNPLTWLINVKTAIKVTGADVHSGTYALKLESKTAAGQTAPGISGLGTITSNTDGAEDFQGVGYTFRPVALTGWYKYEPSGADTCSIEIVLFRWNSSTQARERVGEASFTQTQTISSYTQFSLPITYNSTAFPDTMVIILLTSSMGDQSPVGSKLFIDDLAMDLCTGFSATTSSVNATCVGADGTATATPVNGAGNFTYSWSGGGSSSSKTVAPGNYNVTVTDGNGCSVSSTVAVGSNYSMTLTTSATQTNCTSSTGSATATGTSGTAPYSYLWSNDSTTQTISNLGAGTYTVTISDVNTCSGIATADVTTPNGPAATQTNVDIPCNGLTNGSIDITVTGGTGSISYLWTDGPTTEDRSGLAPGVYCVVATDANACSFAICANITQPAVLSATETITNVSCHGGNTGVIAVSVTGGTSPYTFSGLPNGGGSLAAGNYSITVTDANSCSTTLSATITEPTALAVATTVTNASSTTSNDGSITLATSGGTTPYTITWNTGNGTNLPAGVYCYTVTDANNCTATGCDTVSAPSAINNLLVDKVSLYPNPTSSEVVIERTSGSGNLTFMLFNIEGKLVEVRIINAQRAVVDVRELTSGMYTYQLKDISTGEAASGKLRIER